MQYGILYEIAQPTIFSSHAPLPLVRTDVLEIYHNNIVFVYINIYRGICNFIINHALLYVNVFMLIICRPVFNKLSISVGQNWISVAKLQDFFFLHLVVLSCEYYLPTRT